MSSVPFVRHTLEMNASKSLYHRHRIPSEIISHCVWLYFRFSLSFRDVEHIQQKYQNNRAENSHQPTRLREKVMRRFKSACHAGAIPLCLRTDLITLPGWKKSLLGQRLSRSNEGQIPGLERCHRGPVGILTSAILDRQV